MSYDAASDLKYIDSLDEIPLTGPDLWAGDTDAKLDAAATAESKLEALRDAEEAGRDRTGATDAIEAALEE